MLFSLFKVEFFKVINQINPNRMPLGSSRQKTLDESKKEVKLILPPLTPHPQSLKVRL